MNKDSKIYIAGHLGMVVSAIMRNLQSKGYHNFIVRPINELDLMRTAEVEAFLKPKGPNM